MNKRQLALVLSSVLITSCGGRDIFDSTLQNPIFEANSLTLESPTPVPAPRLFNLSRCPSISAEDFNDRWGIWDGGGGRFEQPQLLDINHFGASVLIYQTLGRGKLSTKEDPALSLNLKELYRAGYILVQIYNAQTFKHEPLWWLQSGEGEAVEKWAENILRAEDENGNILPGAYVHALGFASERMVPSYLSGTNEIVSYYADLKSQCDSGKPAAELARYCAIFDTNNPDAKFLDRYPRNQAQLISRHLKFIERLSIVAHKYKRLFVTLMHSAIPTDFIGIKPEQYNQYSNVLIPWSYSKDDDTISYGANLKYKYKAWRDNRNADVTDAKKRGFIGFLGDIGRKGDVTYADAADAPSDIRSAFLPHIPFYSVFGLDLAYWSFRGLDYNTEFVAQNGDPLMTAAQIAELVAAKNTFKNLFLNLKANFPIPTIRNDECTK